MEANDLVGYSKTVDRNGKLVKYGVLISSGAPFDTHFPSIASRLKVMNDRRNKLPGSHPYDEKGGSQNKWLKKNERDKLSAEIRVALNDISTLVSQYS